MHGLAVVPQSLLRKSFRVANGLCPFRPGVAVAVQCYTQNRPRSSAYPVDRFNNSTV